MSSWQPIETAPKDGTRILGYGLIGFETTTMAATVIWDKFYSEWHGHPSEATEYSVEACKLTHWMPLPEPPK